MSSVHATQSRISRLIKSLTPDDPEEKSLLRALLECAESIYHRCHQDLGLSFGTSSAVLSTGVGAPDLDFESERVLEMIPSEAKREFDGLVEAVEIYYSIHGRSPSQMLAVRDTPISELRSIRDYCLQRGQ